MGDFNCECECCEFKPLWVGQMNDLDCGCYTCDDCSNMCRSCEHSWCDKCGELPNSCINCFETWCDTCWDDEVSRHDNLCENCLKGI